MKIIQEYHLNGLSKNSNHELVSGETSKSRRDETFMSTSESEGTHSCQQSSSCHCCCTSSRLPQRSSCRNQKVAQSSIALEYQKQAQLGLEGPAAKHMGLSESCQDISQMHTECLQGKTARSLMGLTRNAFIALVYCWVEWLQDFHNETHRLAFDGTIPAMNVDLCWGGRGLSSLKGHHCTKSWDFGIRERSWVWS